MPETVAVRLLASMAAVIVAAGAAVAIGRLSSDGGTPEAGGAAVLGASMRSGECAALPGGGARCPVDIDVAPGELAGASGLVPNDRVERLITLGNAGRVDLAEISLTVAPATSTPLTSDQTYGLHLRIDRCGREWAPAGANAYACDGHETAVLAPRPLAVDAVMLPGLASMRKGGRDHLRLTVSMPDSPAGSAGVLGGLRTDVAYEFTATQATGKGRRQ